MSDPNSKLSTEAHDTSFHPAATKPFRGDENNDNGTLHPTHSSVELSQGSRRPDASDGDRRSVYDEYFNTFASAFVGTPASALSLLAQETQVKVEKYQAASGGLSMSDNALLLAYAIGDVYSLKRQQDATDGITSDTSSSAQNVHTVGDGTHVIGRGRTFHGADAAFPRGNQAKYRTLVAHYRSRCPTSYHAGLVRSDIQDSVLSLFATAMRTGNPDVSTSLVVDEVRKQGTVRSLLPDLTQEAYAVREVEQERKREEEAILNSLDLTVKNTPEYSAALLTFSEILKGAGTLQGAEDILESLKNMVLEFEQRPARAALQIGQSVIRIVDGFPGAKKQATISYLAGKKVLEDMRRDRAGMQ